MSQRGRFDAEATAVLLATGGQAALVIVIGSPRGEGFSIATTIDPETIVELLPRALEEVARQIRAGERAVEVEH